LVDFLSQSSNFASTESFKPSRLQGVSKRRHIGGFLSVARDSDGEWIRTLD
ncbi:hypothetical protein BgiMline_011581, partial [Biomphalaria glabrata]